MRYSFSLSDLKIMHDSVLTHEEILKDNSDALGPVEEYTSLRRRLKAMINHIEKEAAVIVEIAGERK